jgi:hypothetical protein
MSISPAVSEDALSLRVGIADQDGTIYQIVEVAGLMQAIEVFEHLHRQGLCGFVPEHRTPGAPLARIFRPA